MERQREGGKKKEKGEGKTRARESFK